MENEIKDGGPAFPSLGKLQKQSYGSTDRSTSYVVEGGEEGMTLRDYFAAKAMQSLVFELERDNSRIFEDSVAEKAYALADAMLAAREGKA